MTTQGESTPPPAAHQHQPAPAHSRGPRVTPRRILLWVVLAGLAAGGSWVVTRPNPGDLVPGLGPTSTRPSSGPPVPGVLPAPPQTEAQSFTAERYFPAQRGLDLDGYKARRSNAGQGADCADTVQDKAHDPLRDTGCQGYLLVAFTRLDQQVTSSVTVLRYADEASARKAEAAVREGAAALLFLPPEGTAPATAPSPSASAAKQPVTTRKVAVVGHYLTVTVSRFADQRTTVPETDHALDEATRNVSYTAGLPFVWM
ncbi:hypothetical protein [Kitasatospora sp. MBT63]|uniref:hypothetical protein n=1 Tax=Kitasatospora sp. MBT63 TaxID=1444768 RepID=UPI0013149DE8|nr:hypothetical protein [Kitasatospora sp. MBT63]